MIIDSKTSIAPEIPPHVQKIYDLLGGGDATLIPIRPGTKQSAVKWGTICYNDTQTQEYLGQFHPAIGIGVVLGKASNNICSIDLDRDELLPEFLTLNTWAHSTLVTKAKRGGNIWVRVTGDYPKTINFTGEGEWRADGGYTIIYGKHPEGMEYIFTKEFKVAEITYDQIVWPPSIKSILDKRYPVTGVTLSSYYSSNSSTLNPDNLKSLSLKSDKLGTLSCESLELKSETLNSLTCNSDNLKTVNCKSETCSPENCETVHCEKTFDPSEAIEAYKKMDQSGKNLKQWKLRLDNDGHRDYRELYENQVENLCKPEVSSRNESMIRAATRLFYSMAEEVALQLMMDFYRINSHWFKDSEATHEKECLAHLKNVATSYLASLNDKMAIFYLGLSDENRPAFRLMRDLSKTAQGKSPRGRFFLSQRQLAVRLGVHQKIAEKCLKDFCDLGVIAHQPNPERRQREAYEYKWLWPLPPDEKGPVNPR